MGYYTVVVYKETLRRSHKEHKERKGHKEGLGVFVRYLLFLPLCSWFLSDLCVKSLPNSRDNFTNYLIGILTWHLAGSYRFVSAAAVF